MKKSTLMHHQPSPFFCIGHRGAAGCAPENTLPSIAKALELGVHAIEIDVQLVEGRLIVLHDERLERTTDGVGLATESTLSYLRSLDAGNGAPIPLLEEVLSLVAGRAKVFVEAKSPGSALAAAQILHHYSLTSPSQAQISSFDHTQLISVRKQYPALAIGVLYFGVPHDLARFPDEIGAESINIALEFLSPAFVHDAHARGIKVFVYTVNQSDELDRLQTLSIDGVITDRPDLLLHSTPHSAI